jgi:hypothetical protein
MRLNNYMWNEKEMLILNIAINEKKINGKN